MADVWSQFPDANESELAGATQPSNGWDAFPDADESLLGSSFAQAVRAAGAPNLGSPSPTQRPIFAGPPSKMEPPPGMSLIDYLRLMQPAAFKRPAPPPASVDLSVPKQLQFGLFGRGPETMVVTADPLVSATYGLEPQALSPSGDAFLRGVELDSVTMSPNQQRLYGVDPVTHLYGPTRSKTFGIGHKIQPQDAGWVANLGGVSPQAQEQRAENLYADDKQYWYDWVRRSVGPQYFDNLAQNQRDALVTTAFNGGGRSISKIIGYIQRNQLDLVPSEFNGWYRRGQIDPGLVKRQLQERALWNGNYHYEPTNEEIDAILEKSGY